MAEFADNDIYLGNGMKSSVSLSSLVSDDMESYRENSDRPWISFEFFPPKTEAGIKCLKKVIAELKEYNPLFVDFTWGAGGSTSDLTFELCRSTKDELQLNPNMHLTCTNMDKSLIDAALTNCKASGITNILALRGDPPIGQEKWTASDATLSCALDLINYIKEQHGDFFSISVSGYPEGHPAAMEELPLSSLGTLSDSELKRFSKDFKSVGEGEFTEEVEFINVCKDHSFAKEMEYLKQKVTAGARFIVTQMFFDVEIYGEFVKACRSVDIHVPIVPGIMCISNYGGFKRMIKFCKTRVTEEILNKIEELKDDVEGIKKFGIELGVKMCRRLQELGAPGFHFYTLNTTGVTVAILEGLEYHRN